MDEKQLSKVLEEVRKGYFKLLDKTNPGLDENTKAVLWLQQRKFLKSQKPSLWPYDIDEEMPEIEVSKNIFYDKKNKK